MNSWQIKFSHPRDYLSTRAQLSKILLPFSTSHNRRVTMMLNLLNQLHQSVSEFYISGTGNHKVNQTYSLSCSSLRLQTQEFKSEGV